MRRAIAVFLLTVLMSPLAAAKDPVMETLSDPAALAEILKKRKPKTAHLEAALNARQGEAAKLLLKAGVKIPSSAEARRTLLDQSIQIDAETVRLLLAAGVPVDVKKYPRESTALYSASFCHDGEQPETIAALLDAGASTSSYSSGDALYAAIAGKCPQHIALLLRRGATTTAPLDWDISPEMATLLLDAGYKPSRQKLEMSLMRASTETLRVILSSGPIKVEDAAYNYYPVQRPLFELASPDLALADLMLPRSISSDFFCPEKINLIAKAALLPDPTVLRYLLKRFSQDRGCFELHPTLLKLAACKGPPEAVSALVAAGAKQESVLHDAIRGECPLAGVKALIAAGVSVDTRAPGSYRTPLETAIWHYRYDKAPSAEPSMELIEALLSEKSKGGFDGLLIALRWPQVARRLIKAGADINVLNSDGKSVLWYAVGRELELGLTLGANPNVADKTGKTPLMAAAESGHTESVALLLKHGADPQHVEAMGRTALQYAREKNHPEVALLLSRITKVAAASPASPAAPMPDIKRLVKQAVAEARKEDRPAPTPAPTAAPASDVDKPRYSSPEDPDAYAIVVGVEEYSDLPKAAFAERDAAAVRRHFKALGVPDRNLVLLSGAKAVRSSMTKYLESWLPKNVTARSMVYFYFSGHGAPDPATGGAYLMPWDGDPSFLSDTAYPLERLYKTLDGLKAKQVVVALDACFSGAGERSVLPEGARPLVTALQKAPTGRLVVLSATQPDQITGVLKEKGHGLFTYHLLKGLGGAAAGPDGAVTPASLHGYLKPKVQDEARRQNRDQTPSLSGPDGVVLRRR